MITGNKTKPTPTNRSEFGVHQISRPKTDVERKAVQCFKALEVQERKFNENGIEFGKAVVALRAEIKARGDRDFITRLKELGISYEKARYWIAKVEQQPTDRHRGAKAAKAEPAKANGQELASDWAKAFASDWNSVLTRLRTVVDEIRTLTHSQEPQEKDNVDLKRMVGELAELLGYELINKQPEKKPVQSVA